MTAFLFILLTLSLIANVILYVKYAGAAGVGIGEKGQIIDENYHLTKALERNNKRLDKIGKKIKAVADETKPDNVGDLVKLFDAGR